MTALEEGDNAHMIEMGVKDEEFINPALIYLKFFELLEDIRNDVAHASAHHHRTTVSLQEINPGFLTA
jgi:hypothetical protein